LAAAASYWLLATAFADVAVVGHVESGEKEKAAGTVGCDLKYPTSCTRERNVFLFCHYNMLIISKLGLLISSQGDDTGENPNRHPEI
jgi:hypothetical protein